MKENNNIDLMGWNAPNSNNNGSDKDSRNESNNSYQDDNDPWKRHSNRQKKQSESPLNLLKKILGGSSNSSKGSKKSSFGLGFIFVLLLGFFIFTGFYTVKEAERGVVLRFGKVYEVVEPGLRWMIPGIDEVNIVDIEQVRSIQSSGSMLTEDENVVIVEMDVQYRISDPIKYLYSVTNPDHSLLEATDSALRYVVGHSMMDDILTSGREVVRQNTRDLLVSIIEPYNMGLSVVDVNFLPARAPNQVKEAFDDAIAAQEDEQRFKREAEAYANEVIPRAEGQVQRIRQEAEAYRSQVVLNAEGEVARFQKLLPEFNAAPDITRTRIYLDTMQEVLGSSSKVIVDTKNGQSPVLYMPFPQMTDKKDTSSLKDEKSQYGVDSTPNTVEIPVVNTETKTINTNKRQSVEHYGKSYNYNSSYGTNY